MIVNDHQRQITDDKLTRHRQRLERLRAKHPEPEDFALFASPTQRHIEQMQRELAYYCSSAEIGK